MVLLVVWIHLLATVAWIGGMMFLSIVLVPVLRRGGQFAQHAALFRTVAHRFRGIVWGAMGLLIGTGLMIADGRSIALTEPRTWPAVFAAKITLVMVLFSLTLLHDLLLGPKVRRILGKAAMERTAGDGLLLRYAALLPRFSLILALVVLLSAVVLART